MKGAFRSTLGCELSCQVSPLTIQWHTCQLYGTLANNIIVWHACQQYQSYGTLANSISCMARLPIVSVVQHAYQQWLSVMWHACQNVYYSKYSSVAGLPIILDVWHACQQYQLCSMLAKISITANTVHWYACQQCQLCGILAKNVYDNKYSSVTYLSPTVQQLAYQNTQQPYTYLSEFPFRQKRKDDKCQLPMEPTCQYAHAQIPILCQESPSLKVSKSLIYLLYFTCTKMMPFYLFQNYVSFMKACVVQLKRITYRIKKSLLQACMMQHLEVMVLFLLTCKNRCTQQKLQFTQW